MKSHGQGPADAQSNNEDPFLAFRSTPLRLKAVAGETALITFLFGGFVFHRAMTEEALRPARGLLVVPIAVFAVVAVIGYIRAVGPMLDRASERAREVFAQPLEASSARAFREDVMPVVWRAPLLGFGAMLVTAVATAWYLASLLPPDCPHVTRFGLGTLGYGTFVAAISSLETARTMLFASHAVHLASWRRLRPPPRNRFLAWLERAAFKVPPAVGPFVLGCSFVVVSLVGLETDNHRDTWYRIWTYSLLAICPVLTGLMIYVGEQVEVSGRDISMLQAFIGCEPGQKTSHVAFESFLRTEPVRRSVLSFLRPLVVRQLHLAVHCAQAVRSTLDSVDDDIRAESPEAHAALRGALEEAKAKVALFEEYPTRLEGLFDNWFTSVTRPPRGTDFLGIVRGRVRHVRGRPGHVRLELSGIDEGVGVTCNAPSSALKLILDSLLDNALVATRHLAERATGAEPLVLMRVSLEEEGWVTLDVLDRGIGLLPRMKDQLQAACDVQNRHEVQEERPTVAFFEAAINAGQPYPFVWNKRTVGLGLGLYFVDAITAAYGGRLHIDASPQPPWSTRVRVSIPCKVNSHVSGRKVSGLQKARLAAPVRLDPVGLD
jgi:signal transduction histidine kinase